MKAIIGVFTLLGLVATGLLATTGVRAEEQIHPTIRTQDNLPVLETPTATSAMVLGELQNRRVSTDFDFIFLPPGSGGEQSGGPADQTWSYSEMGLEPVATEIARQIDQETLPVYALVEPNRPIETQTDPQRLTVVTP